MEKARTSYPELTENGSTFCAGVKRIGGEALA